MPDKANTFAKVVLWLGVLTFGGFGVAFIVAFDPLAEKLGIVHNDGAASFLYILLALEAAGAALTFFAMSRVQ